MITKAETLPLPKGKVKRLKALSDRDNGRLVIIVPVYNEAEAIIPFLHGIRPFLQDIENVTIMFVNDGSKDETLSILMEQAEIDPAISIVNLARNFGKEAAMCAGLDLCDCDAAIIMDVDLQDPPELIPKFYQFWLSGYDVVLGERSARKSDTWLKRKTASVFYTVFNRLSETQIPNNVGDFRLLDNRVIFAINQLRERNRFMKGLYAWVGFSTISIPYDRPARLVGETKFKFKGLWRFALDGIFGFSTVPLKLSIYVGTLVGLCAIFYAMLKIIQTVLFGIDVPGYASLIVVILSLSSVQLFALGIIGEYIARITLETKQRPLYIVEGHYMQERT